MKDFPCFATDDGVASLILKEIPYRKEAYIRFQDVQPGRFAPFLQECVSFCRMAGAEKIYAQGHEELSQYPLHAAVYEMRGKAWVDTKAAGKHFSGDGSHGGNMAKALQRADARR